MNYFCPVCGYNLGFSPWNGSSPSDEICPSCGIQFGYDDSAGGDLEKRSMIYKKWRQDWINNGMKWYSKNDKPKDWDPKQQLDNIKIIESELEK